MSSSGGDDGEASSPGSARDSEEEDDAPPPDDRVAAMDNIREVFRKTQRSQIDALLDGLEAVVDAQRAADMKVKALEASMDEKVRAVEARLLEKLPPLVEPLHHRLKELEQGLEGAFQSIEQLVMVLGAGGNQTARCFQDAISLCAAWSGRVPEHLSEILVNFGDIPTQWSVAHRSSAPASGERPRPCWGRRSRRIFAARSVL